MGYSMDSVITTAITLVFWASITNGDVTINVGQNKYEKNNQCKVDFVIKGNDISDVQTASCDLAESMGDPLYTTDGFVLGNYKLNRLCVFSDSAGTLVMISGNKQKCSKRKNVNGKMQTVTIDEAECDSTKAKIDTIWQKKPAGMGRKDPVKSKKSAKNVDVNDMHVTRRISKKDSNYCTMKLFGKGILYRTSLLCNIAQHLEVLGIPNGIIMGDYRYNPVCAYTVSPEQLIVIEGEEKKCNRKTYKAKKEIKSVELSVEECNNIKAIAKKEWDSKYIEKKNP